MLRFRNSIPVASHIAFLGLSLSRSTGRSISSRTLVGLTLILTAMLSAQYYLGWWEFGRIGWATGISQISWSTHPGPRADWTHCTSEKTSQNYSYSFTADCVTQTRVGGGEWGRSRTHSLLYYYLKNHILTGFFNKKSLLLCLLQSLLHLRNRILLWLYGAFPFVGRCFHFLSPPFSSYPCSAWRSFAFRETRTALAYFRPRSHSPSGQDIAGPESRMNCTRLLIYNWIHGRSIRDDRHTLSIPWHTYVTCTVHFK